MKVYLHDNSRLEDLKYDLTFKPICGERGHTHCGTANVDYEYQVEMLVFDEIQTNYPEVVRVEVPALGREWKRIDGKFVEQK